MLSRVLENEAMDTVEEAIEYDRMDHSSVNGRFVEDFLRFHGPCRGGEIVDVGTGTARIPIVLCQADSEANVLGIDLSEPMLNVASKNVQEAGLNGRIRVAKFDAKNVTLISGAYEALISNSIVHHIPEPLEAIIEMVRLVAPGGTLFIRDLCRPENDEVVETLVETYAGGESPKAKALFDASLRAALSLDEIRAIAEKVEQPAANVTMSSDRHWTWAWGRPT